MVKRRRSQKQTTAALEYLPGLSHGGPIDQWDIALLRYVDPYVHIAQGGDVKGANQRCIGNEIRSDDAYGLSRRSQRCDKQIGELFEVFVRAVGNALCPGSAGALRSGKPATPLERFAGGKRPVDREGLLQVMHYRAFHSEVQALHGVFRSQTQPMPFADVGPTGKSNLAVHHHDLAVITQVGVLQQARHSCGQKSGRGNSLGPQTPHHVGATIP